MNDSFPQEILTVEVYVIHYYQTLQTHSKLFLKYFPDEFI